jgi:Arm DNA-binding domain
MPKLTKRIVDAAEVRAREYFVWDEDLPGFGLRVLPSGRKRYVIQYRAGRRSRRISLGPSMVLTCEQARSRAVTIIAATKNGDDPAARRDADRRAITVRELAERFEKEHINLRLKPSTAKGYIRQSPAAGGTRIDRQAKAATGIIPIR